MPACDKRGTPPTTLADTVFRSGCGSPHTATKCPRVNSNRLRTVGPMKNFPLNGMLALNSDMHTHTGPFRIDFRER